MQQHKGNGESMENIKDLGVRPTAQTDGGVASAKQQEAKLVTEQLKRQEPAPSGDPRPKLAEASVIRSIFSESLDGV